MIKGKPSIKGKVKKFVLYSCFSVFQRDSADVFERRKVAVQFGQGYFFSDHNLKVDLYFSLFYIADSNGLNNAFLLINTFYQRL
ncbi:Uncharacterised protein [Citrobacter koseri]|uniref:Uncharacterized protein n=1 Tax=Citrobacter koseri TaxID=545 RepID=A0A2X2V7F7_CITKO|nr:Uncharacterised protein [Citrobacter koseri]